MLPITRATIQSFCRACLQEVPSQSKAHNIECENKLAKWYTAITTCQIESKTSKDYPKSLCHSCYTKSRTYQEFQEVAHCAGKVLQSLLDDPQYKNLLKHLNNFCRTCLKKLKSTEISARINRETDVKRFLEEATNIYFKSSDERLIVFICNLCYKKLQNFIEFRKMAKQSFEYLENVLDVNRKTEKKMSSVSEGQKESKIFVEQLPTLNSVFIEMEKNVDIRDSEMPTAGEPEFEWLNEQMDSMDQIDTGDESSNSENESCKTPCNVSTETECDPIYKVIMTDEYSIGESTLSTEEDCQPGSSSTKGNQISETTSTSKIKTAVSHLHSDETSLDTPKCPNDGSVYYSEIYMSEILARKLSYNCDHCGKNFRKKFWLNAHVRQIHENVELPFQCEHCPKTYKFHQHCWAHMKRSHAEFYNTKIEVRNPEENLRERTCEICCKTFKRKYHLKDHISSVHKDIRPFKCNFCDKTFASNRTTRIHEMMHTGVRPYTCEYCQKGFCKAADLKIHKERHTTKPELLCPICKRAQKTSEDLKKHIAAHDIAMRHQCPKCGRIFKKISHLQEHDNAVHLKLRPYKCQFCEKCFALTKTCRAHERTHTNERPEVCPICEKTFKTSSSLCTHMKLHGKQLKPRRGVNYEYVSAE